MYHGEEPNPYEGPLAATHEQVRDDEAILRPFWISYTVASCAAIVSVILHWCDCRFGVALTSYAFPLRTLLIILVVLGMLVAAGFVGIDRRGLFALFLR
jgi:ABC-type spermidine/putrescine transport system permease subunit II